MAFSTTTHGGKCVPIIGPDAALVWAEAATTFETEIQKAMANAIREAVVKRRAHEIIKRYTCYRFMPATGGYGKSGVFDEVLCLQGVFIGIEYKRDAKHLPTVLQGQNATDCRAAGGLTLLIHNGNLGELESILSIIASAPDPATAAKRAQTMTHLYPGTCVWEGKKVVEVSI